MNIFSSKKTEDEYLLNLEKRLEKRGMSDRFFSSLKWYVSAARKNKCAYYVLNVLAVVAPIIGSGVEIIFDTTYASLISIISSIAVALLGVFQCQRKWLLYRSNAECVKSKIEIFLSDNNADESKFVKEFEDLLSTENENWQNINTSNT